MTFVELNKKAKEVAEKNLERGFDWQAFLVLSTAIINEERIGKPVDLVPDSTVDEGIQYLLKLFSDYINAKKSYAARAGNEKAVKDALEKWMAQNVKILKEIRLSCDSAQEKECFKKYIDELKKLG